MKIDILGGSEEGRYKASNCQSTINWYPVSNTQLAKDKEQLQFSSTPGLTSFTEVGGRNTRALFVARPVDLPARCFQVVDQILWEIKTDGSVQSRGTLSNIAQGTTKVYMKVNGNDQMYIGHPSAGYNFDLNTNLLTQITDIDYPDMDTAAYMDGYLIISKSGRAYFNEVLNDFTSWNGADVFTPTYRADPCIAVECYREEIYAFGTETIEVYLNDGTSPFIRKSGTTNLIGLKAQESIACNNDGIIFLGTTQDGEIAVYNINANYTATQISDFNLTWTLNNTAGPFEDAYAYIQTTKNGNVWYYLTIPSLKTTYVYDLLTKQWHQRKSKAPFNDSNGDPIYSVFRGRYYVNFNGKALFADLYSSKVFKESFTVSTEDSLTILRQRTSANYSQELQYISVSSLEIDTNIGEAATNTGQGSSPILMLEISRDGGYTFGNPRDITLGQLGQYRYRGKINKLGTARNWVLRLTCTDPINIMLQSAIAHGSVSN